MPQRDADHESVKRAVSKDGWTITNDPYTLTFLDEQVYIDLGASALIGAEQATRTIAVEVKSFSGLSVIADVQQALGQYLLYRSWLARTDPDRRLWLAVSVEVAENVLVRPAIQVLLTDYTIHLVVVDTFREEIVEWISESTIGH